MNAQVKFYQAGFADEAPEMLGYREEINVVNKEELIKYSMDMELPSSVEYAHIYVDGEPIIAVTRNGIRDVEENTWIVEPHDEDE